MEDRFEHAVDHAQMAFWNQFAACYPEVTTGDFPPDTDFALDEALKQAARTWLFYNAPPIQEGSCYRLTRSVERYPHFQVPAGATGTVMEANGDIVRLRMHELVAGAEDWDNEIVWSSNDDEPHGISAVYAFLRDVKPHLLDIVATPVLKVHQCVDVDIEGNFVRVVHLVRTDGSHAIKVHGLNCDLEGEEPGLYRLDKRPPPTVTVTAVLEIDADTEGLDQDLVFKVPGVRGVPFIGPGDLTANS